MRLNLRQLGYFVAIMDARSMSRAAELLNITPTSLSLQMKQMEVLLETRLLTRHSRGVTPTERGAALYERAVRILDLVRETEQQFIDAGKDEARTLRVGLTPAVARMVGIEAMTGIGARLKNLTLLLSEGWTSEMMPKLSRGALDFVISYDLEAQGEVEVVDFYEEEFLFVCRKGLFPEDSAVELPVVIDSGLVFYGQNSVSWRAMTDAAKVAGLSFTESQAVESIDVWRGMLCRGFGTSIAPLGAVADEVRHGDLSAHRIGGTPIIRRIGIAARKEMLEHGHRSGFVDYISELVGAAQPCFLKGDATADL